MCERVVDWLNSQITRSQSYIDDKKDKIIVSKDCLKKLNEELNDFENELKDYELALKRLLDEVS